MKIIKPYARMLAIADGMLQPPGESQDGFNCLHGLALLRHIEWCARVSHRSEDSVTEDSWKRIIKSVVLDHGDWSVTEHASVTVDAVVDRGITHEWVRHRLFGYTQESTRFVNYEKKIPPSFIYPQVGVECALCLNPQPNWGGSSLVKIQSDKGFVYQHETTGAVCDRVPCSYHPDWLESINVAENSYKALLTFKWRPQEARSVFPNALASRLISTSNLRNWRHFFIMRTSAEVHPQMKQVTIPLLKEFQEKIPLLYDDIVPEQKQSEAMKRAR